MKENRVSLKIQTGWFGLFGFGLNQNRRGDSYTLRI